MEDDPEEINMKTEIKEEPYKSAELVMNGDLINQFDCYGVKELFGKEWDDIPKIHQDIIKKQGSLPCEGYGAPSGSCWSCHYGTPRG